MKKALYVGGVKIGGGARVKIHTMSDLPTYGIDGVVRQAADAARAGCDIFRVAVPDLRSAEAVKELKRQISMPIVADVHFDYKLGLAAIASGADKLRINPGNIPEAGLKKLASAAKERGIPIRVGVNGGSLEKKYAASADKSEALAMSAVGGARLLESCGFSDIVLSLKASSVKDTVLAYRLADKLCDYPLHIGITEAGTPALGIYKSAVGLGALLLDGIGDTLRVSLTASPVEEVIAAREILRASGYDKRFAEVISCPKCGRCGYDTAALAALVEKTVSNVEKPLRIAVMGCVVNGPGEAKDCDLGIAFGDGRAALFKDGKVYKTVPEAEAEKAFLEELKILIRN